MGHQNAVERHVLGNPRVVTTCAREAANGLEPTSSAPRRGCATERVAQLWDRGGLPGRKGCAAIQTRAASAAAW